MIRIGLTGGIAAGKSVVSARFAELGAVVVDHDLLARAAVAPGTIGLDQIVATFGDEILTPQGELDRPALGRVVFGDQEALDKLSAIVHPEVRRLSVEREAAADAADTGAIVVHDIPLLVETDQADEFHIVVLVDTPAELRIRRLVEQRGHSLPEAQQRVAAQASDAQRRAAADVILDGSGDRAELCAQVDVLWARLQDEVVQESTEP